MRSIAFFMLLISCLNLQAQLKPWRNVASQQGSYLTIHEFQSKPVEGYVCVYLNKNWYHANIYHKSGVLINKVKTKYDIKNSYLELDLDSTVKLLEASKVDSFVLYRNKKDSVKYINCNHFPVDEYTLGFFRILADGKMTLLEKPSFKVTRPDYNVALDIGSKVNRYFKKEEYYILEEGTFKSIPQRKKDIIKMFGLYASKVKTYAKKNKLKVKRIEDLAELISYYNEELVR